MISLILFLRSPRQSWLIVPRDIELTCKKPSCELFSSHLSIPSGWLSLSSIVHITCSLFVITLLSRFSRKTVSCSFLRTWTARSSRAPHLSRANGITSSCLLSQTPYELSRRYVLRRKNSAGAKFHLLCRDSQESPLDSILVVTRQNYRSSFFPLPPLSSPASRRKKDERTRRARSWIAREIKASPFGETTTRRL